MTAADWGVLVPSIAAFLTAAAAWLRVRAHEASQHDQAGGESGQQNSPPGEPVVSKP